MICSNCGKDDTQGIENRSKGRFLCSDCCGEMLRPMGAEPGEDVKVEFPNDGKVVVRVSSYAKKDPS